MSIAPRSFNRSSHLGRLTVLCILAIACICRAEDNTTTTFSGGGATNLGGVLTIGSTGTNNILLISNGTRVTNTVGTIGDAATANYNQGTVTGGGLWYNNGSGGGGYSFYVGDAGSSNTLVISNGGVVNGGGAVSIVGMAASAIGNSATVTGSGSLWSNTLIRVGGDVGGGSSNRLTVINGGRVVVSGLDIGYAGAARGNLLLVDGASSLVNSGSMLLGAGGDDNEIVIQNGGRILGGNLTMGSSVGSDGNRVLVTGPGSTFSNVSVQGMIVGNSGAGNSVTITNGGTVYVDAFSVGFQYIGLNASSSNNYLRVTGANSSYINKYGLTVGQGGRSNAFLVSDGATAVIRGENAGFDYGLTIGASAGADNNLVRIDSGRLLVTNNLPSNMYIDVRRGTLEINGGNVEGERLFATNGASSVVSLNGGTLAVRSTTISNGSSFSVGNGSGATAELRLRGGTHSFADGLTIATDGVLSGTGTVQGTTTVLGTLSPGNSPGKLQLGNLTLATNSTFLVELNGLTVGTQYDQADVTGSVALDNGLLTISLGFSPVTSNQFTIINNDAADSVSGIFNGLPEGSVVTMDGVHKFGISYIGGDGNDVVLTFLVPEPSSLALVLMGTLGVAAIRRRTRLVRTDA